MSEGEGGEALRVEQVPIENEKKGIYGIGLII